MLRRSQAAATYQESVLQGSSRDHLTLGHTSLSHQTQQHCVTRCAGLGRSGGYQLVGSAPSSPCSLHQSQLTWWTQPIIAEWADTSATLSLCWETDSAKTLSVLDIVWLQKILVDGGGGRINNMSGQWRIPAWVIAAGAGEWCGEVERAGLARVMQALRWLLLLLASDSLSYNQYWQKLEQAAPPCQPCCSVISSRGVVANTSSSPAQPTFPLSSVV